MKSMKVAVQVELEVVVGERHLREMRSAAQSVTDDPHSIRVTVDPDDARVVLAEFTMPRSLQRDVVDRILSAFRMLMPDYAGSSVWFPKPPKGAARKNKRHAVPGEFTPKQGQYLAFIYNYQVINGRPPAEADLGRFFGTTPPTIHQMILALENKELIAREPGRPRSVRVLVPPERLPVLQACGGD